ncbi:MAG: entericidin A/B family lipoprotein [Phycisphaerales bacterium]
MSITLFNQIRRKWIQRVVGTACLGVLSVVVLTSLPGCNTTEGVGKDIKSAGAGLEDAARDAKD